MTSSGIIEYSHQFLRGADFRAGIPASGTDASNDGPGFGIVEMSEVPGQKIIDTVHGGYSNMQSIIQSLGREGFPLEKRLGQSRHGLRDRKYGHTRQYCEPSLRCLGVAPCRLFKRNVRRVEIEPVSLGVPPVDSGPLPGSSQQVVRRPSGQIRHDRGFDVDGFSMHWCLSARCAESMFQTPGPPEDAMTGGVPTTSASESPRVIGTTLSRGSRARSRPKPVSWSYLVEARLPVDRRPTQPTLSLASAPLRVVVQQRHRDAETEGRLELRQRFPVRTPGICAVLVSRLIH